MSEKKKRTKLKKIEFSSVDMVRRGANQEAFINLYKSAGEATDPETLPGATEAPNPDGIPQGLWKSIVDAVKGFLGTGEAETPPPADPEEVEKGADTFAEKMSQNELRENRWKYQDALNMSIESILNDNELSDEEKTSKLNESVDQFSAAYKELCAKLVTTANKAAEATVQPKAAIGKTQDDDDPDYNEEGEEEMRIDKSRFTPEELAQYETLINKGRVDEEPEYVPEVEAEVEKSAELHPEVKKALEEMETLKKSLAMKEMTDIAKKYAAPLGKKEDELANTLYNMKKSSQESYDAYIAILDQNLDLVNKSGIFEEIGKSSRGMAGGSTLEKIEGIATELQKSDVTLNRTAAIAKAWDQHPELVAEYDNEYMGGK